MREKTDGMLDSLTRQQPLNSMQVLSVKQPKPAGAAEARPKGVDMPPIPIDHSIQLRSHSRGAIDEEAMGGDHRSGDAVDLTKSGPKPECATGHRAWKHP